MTNPSWSQISKAWSKEFFGADSQKSAAIQRALPLLDDPTAVPFVCRYRTDVIQGLSNKEIHELAEMVQTWKSLASLRQRILSSLPDADPQLKLRVETSISKAELEDIYAPLKPPSKGSLEDRIRREHPELIPKVDSFFADCTTINEGSLKPREAAVTLLANKIASHTPTTDSLLEYVAVHVRVQTSKASTSSKSKDKSTASLKKSGSGNKDNENENDKKYGTYYDFSASLSHLFDHQVLAIRRGVNNDAIKMAFVVDAERTESRIRRSLIDEGIQKRSLPIWQEAIHDAWSRLLRKRTTSRLWRDKCSKAEEKAMRVFCDNLQKALLAPPMVPTRPILALDPGFAAGIKCAILDKNGQLLFDEDTSLMTIKFLNEHRQEAIQNIIGLLQILYSAQESDREEIAMSTTSKKPKKTLVTVALGNGHGSQEVRELIRDASDKSGIPIEIKLVNEAGASVWSVTEGANREFPNQQAAAIAAVSIGRRLQNPLPELVKIPPRSLGLGMYQHDLSKKTLDEKLHVTSVHAVAEVGVDGNACSLEILEKIPGLTTSLSKKIIEARPLKSRSDMLKRVAGMGPKTFENAAAFIRIEEGEEPLDSTLVHPESYALAQYLLKNLKWKLHHKKLIQHSDLPKSNEEREKSWGELIDKASKQFDVTTARVLSVIDHLIVSMTNPDPRLSGSMSIIGSASSSNSANNAGEIGSVDGCSLLPSDLSKSHVALQKACPVRGIIGTVRTVVDFGAFCDFGSDNDGLLHRSKLGPVPLSSLLVGQEIGIDVLNVSDNGRISLALTGLNADPPMGGNSSNGSNGKRSYSTLSSKMPAKHRRV